MSLALNEDQRDLRESVRRAIQSLAGVDRTRDFIEGRLANSAEIWEALDRSLSLVALPIPVAEGGEGATWTEVGIVLEELGRTLVPTPYLSLATAVRILMRCQTDPAREALTAIAERKALPLVAFIGNDAGNFSVDNAPNADIGTTVAVSGVTALIPHHDGADSALLAAPDGDHLTLILLSTADLNIEAVPTIDLTRPMCIVTADSAKGTVIATTGVRGIVDDARSFAAAAIAMESVGGSDVCLTKTVDYARDRLQFGKAIGSYQGVKHACADLLRICEPARSAAYAAFEAANDGCQFKQIASIAKLVNDQAYATVSVESVQLHGGIGFTWELDLHLHYKRAVANRVIGPTVREHRSNVRSMVAELPAVRTDAERPE